MNEANTIGKNKIKLLLLGDIVYETTDAMLKLLEVFTRNIKKI